MYKVDYFPIPQAYNFGEALVKIPGLDGAGKMGKSEGNAVLLADTPEAIRKKVMKAVTDSGPTEKNQQKPEAIQNLFTLMDVVSKPETVSFFEEAYNDCSIRYGDLKKQLAEDIIDFNAPFRDKILSLSENDAYLREVTSHGADVARESARKTIGEVREIIGFKPF